MSNIDVRRLIAGTVLGVTAGTAAALTPADGLPQLVLYIPGSQANDKFFEPALCLTGTSHVYFQNYTPADPTKATNNDYWAVYCSTNGTKISGLTGTQRLWISRRRLGASYVGLDAVSNGTTLDYLLDPATANCTAFNGSFTSGGTTFTYNYSCGTVTGGVTATAATSDVTADVFHGAENVPAGKADIKAGTLPNNFAIAGHIIGAPVTLKLRNALQYAQVLSGSLPSNCAQPGVAPSNVTVPGPNGSTQTVPITETEQCMPSLSKQQLASLFSGSVSDWDSFYVDVAGTPTTLSAIATQWTSLGGDATYLNAPHDTTVHICRRENGAGQQVALLASILQSPCLGDSAPKLATNGGFTDAQFATSLGQEDNCLTDFNNGGSKFFPAANPAPGNQWAIGIQTTERNMSRSAPYRFIKIDGAAPTLTQVGLGRYPLWSEYGIAWKNNVTTDQNKALLAIVQYGQNPANVASRNAGAVHSFGPAGYVALSSNGYAPDPVFNPANPVNPYTHSASGKPDACAIPVVNPDYATVQMH